MEEKSYARHALQQRDLPLRRRRRGVELPGGGDFGDPAERDPEQVALDVADGLISREVAEREYRVALATDGSLDRDATERLCTS